MGRAQMCQEAFKEQVPQEQGGADVPPHVHALLSRAEREEDGGSKRGAAPLLAEVTVGGVRVQNVVLSPNTGV